MLALYGGLQVLFVLVIRKPYYQDGVSWPVQTMGILAFITLISGYLPIPFELIKRRGRVVGISLVFLTVDWFGAFFSLMSLGTSPFSSIHWTLLTVAREKSHRIRSTSCLGRCMPCGKHNNVLEFRSVSTNTNDIMILTTAPPLK